MVKIKKGNHTRTVTKGSFLNQYKKQGWTEVNEVNQEVDVDVDKIKEAIPFLEEIPIGKMSKDQLFEYAEQLELELPEEITKKELKAMIKEYLDSLDEDEVDDAEEYEDDEEVEE